MNGSHQKKKEKKRNNTYPPDKNVLFVLFLGGGEGEGGAGEGKRDRVGDVLYYLGVKRNMKSVSVQEKEIKKKPIDMIYVAKCKKICFKPIKIHSD